MGKAIKLFLAAAVCISTLTACNGGDPGTDPVTPPDGEAEVLELTADKYTLTADGADEVVFTAKLDGEDVTPQCEIFVSGAGSVESNVFTTKKAGEYTFYAHYDPDGKPGGYVVQSEEITVTAERAPDPLLFDPALPIEKNVAFFTWTNTMTDGSYDFKCYMENLVADHGDNVVQVNLHTHISDNIGAPVDVSKTVNELKEEGRFDLIALGGYPMSLADLRENFASPGYVPSEAQLRAAYGRYIGNSPKTGVMVEASITQAYQGKKAKVDATVTIGAREAGDYYIGIFLTEDNISAHQLGFGEGYIHSDVARHIGAGLFGDFVSSMTVGQTIEKEFSLTIEDNYDQENLHLVIYTVYNEGGYNIIDNTVKVPAEGVTGFNYSMEN